MPDENGFRRRVASGAASTLVAQLVRIVVTFISTIVVARVLSPHDYGIYAMAAPVMGFAMLFQNLGFDHAVVQARDVSDTQLSSLFWLNVALCVVLAGLLLAVSPLVSSFYGNPASGHLVAASSCILLVMAPNPLYNAMLNRKMRFHAQSMVDIGSSLVMLVASVVGAIVLRSYWALWIGALAATATNTVCFLYLERWRPKLIFNWQAIAPLVGFGGGVSIYGFTTYITRNVDNILLAKVWGPATLGLYDRAYKLMLYPLQNFSGPLGRNLLPVLAQTREDADRFRRAYLLFVQAVVTAAVPGIVVGSIAANDVVALLLGPRWAAAAPIFGWLSAAAALLIVNEAAPWLFISTGRIKAMMRWGLFASTTVVAGFVIGLPWGGRGMAIAYFVGELLRTPLLVVVATRGTPVRAGDFLRLHLVTVAAAVSAVAVAYLLGPQVPLIVRLALLVTVAYAAAGLTQTLSEPGRLLLNRTSELLRHIARRGRVRSHPGKHL